MDPHELDDIGMKFSCQLFNDFIRTQNGRVTAVDIQEEFNVKAELFDQFMAERVLPNFCTFFQTYGPITQQRDVYVFPKLGGKTCRCCPDQRDDDHGSYVTT
jgi:hypothetical protein